MKNIVKLVIAIVFVAMCNNVSAQTQKLAHISMQELITAMPEYEKAMAEFQKIQDSLGKNLEELQVEYRRKLDEYSKNQEGWTELVKQSKIDEIQSMERRIQAFQEGAQESLQQEYTKLLQPVLEKANKAVDAVAKEKGVEYVISADNQILVFKAVGTLDLLPAVKQHLGIKN